MSLVMEWLDDTLCVRAHTQRHDVLCPKKEIKPRVPTVSLENAHDSSRVQTPAAALSTGSCHSLHLLCPVSQDTAWQVSGLALRER